MNAFHAAGTCTYMIFCRSPMSLSGGLVSTAKTCAPTSASSASAPNHSRLRATGGACVADSLRPASTESTEDISDLNDVIERERGCDEKYRVERSQKPHPRSGIVHRVPGQ